MHMTYYEKNKEKILKQIKEYQTRNKEKIKERRKKYSLKNREKLTAYNAEWKEKNRERFNDYMRKYHRNNRDAVREAQHQCYLKNPLRREKIMVLSDKIRSQQQAETLQNNINHGCEFTCRDDKYIIETYNTLNRKTVALHLGRTLYSIKSRVRALRIMGRIKDKPIIRK